MGLCHQTHVTTWGTHFRRGEHFTSSAPPRVPRTLVTPLVGGERGRGVVVVAGLSAARKEPIGVVTRSTSPQIIHQYQTLRFLPTGALRILVDCIGQFITTCPPTRHPASPSSPPPLGSLFTFSVPSFLYPSPSVYVVFRLNTNSLRRLTCVRLRHCYSEVGL